MAYKDLPIRRAQFDCVRAVVLSGGYLTREIAGEKLERGYYGLTVDRGATADEMFHPKTVKSLIELGYLKDEDGEINALSPSRVLVDRVNVRPYGRRDARKQKGVKWR